LFPSFQQRAQSDARALQDDKESTSYVYVLIFIIRKFNINCLQEPIGNEELIQIVNMTIATRDTK
jgi:hypothetical protein